MYGNLHTRNINYTDQNDVGLPCFRAGKMVLNSSIHPDMPATGRLPDTSDEAASGLSLPFVRRCVQPIHSLAFLHRFD